MNWIETERDNINNEMIYDISETRRIINLEPTRISRRQGAFGSDRWCVCVCVRARVHV